MVGNLFARDLFREFDLLQRDVQQAFGISPSIRGLARGGFPALNVGMSAETVDVYVFAPGLDGAGVSIEIDKGVLTVAGERRLSEPAGGERTTVHIDERFAGRFRRVVSLPDDIDAAAASARCRDGVLHVRIPRRAAPQPHRVNVQ